MKIEQIDYRYRNEKRETPQTIRRCAKSQTRSRQREDRDTARVLQQNFSIIAFENVPNGVASIFGFENYSLRDFIRRSYIGKNKGRFTTNGANNKLR